MKWSQLNPAWVQAVGSLLALGVAIATPALQRRSARREARIQRARERKERLERLIAGLRAEVSAVVETASMHREVAERTLSQLENAKQAGHEILESPFPEGSFSLTDSIVFKALAPELGTLPPELVQEIVTFYSLNNTLGRIVDINPSVEAALKDINGLIPRVQMHGSIILKQLDKFKEAGFAQSTNLHLDPTQAQEIATQFGYPIEQVLAERGLTIKEGKLSPRE